MGTAVNGLFEVSGVLKGIDFDEYCSVRCRRCYAWVLKCVDYLRVMCLSPLFHEKVRNSLCRVF